MTDTSTGRRAVEVRGPAVPRSAEILTDDAVTFVAELQRRFGARRDGLLAARARRRAEAASTGRLHFLPGTAGIRRADWVVAPAPADLLDRRVEITRPPEPKMAINALNSGAKVWLADLEDANTPHWSNVVGGQVTLFDAVRRRLEFTSPEGRHYRLAQDRPLAVIVARPRGWHFDEWHLLVDGAPAVGESAARSSTGSSARRRTSWAGAAATSPSPRRSCWTSRRCRARSPKQDCAPTSRWPCVTWRRGSAATAPSASTT